MKEQIEEFTAEEKLRNDTEILKLKLEIEKGAIIGFPEGAPRLPADIENAWYNHIYNYERLCKEAGYTTVYDFIGSPGYRKISEIPLEEINNALDKLLEYMQNKGIKFAYEEDCYPASTLYSFVTEELFDHEICRYQGPEGGCTVFCYEEFYPNHERDIFRYSMEFIFQLFDNRTWNPKFVEYTHEKEVLLNGEICSLEEYSNRIFSFKEKFPAFLFSEPKIGQIIFDIESSKGKAEGTIEMLSDPIPFVIHFYYSYGMWAISGFELELIKGVESK